MPSDATRAKELAGLLRERIGSEFDNECHLSGDEAREAASLIERLCRERDEARAKAYFAENEVSNLKDVIHEKSTRLGGALRPFVFGAAELEQILFDGLPDDASGTITISLGDIRRARRALAREDVQG